MARLLPIWKKFSKENFARPGENSNACYQMGEQDRACGDIHKAESLVSPGLLKNPS